jgi:serine/threonine protein kinase
LGLARFADDVEASLTKVHDENVLGTADYLAPEQALDSHNVDVRADIYSLGCTLYFVLTGHPPFPDGTLPQRLMAHQKTEPPDIRLDRNDAPSDLIQICRRMMAKSPDERYQSAAEVFEAMCEWLAVHGEAYGFDSSTESSSSIKLAAAVSAKSRSMGDSGGLLSGMRSGDGADFSGGSSVVHGDHDPTVDELIALDDTAPNTFSPTTVKKAGHAARQAPAKLSPGSEAKRVDNGTPAEAGEQESEAEQIARVTIGQRDWGRLLSAERNAPRLSEEKASPRHQESGEPLPVVVWIAGGVCLVLVVILVITLAVFT